eukprot:5583540-Ditylum_brightwellii.AAC.1
MDMSMVDGGHPKIDKSSPLDDKVHQSYQILIGIKEHIDQVLCIFEYLKKYKNCKVIVNSRDLILEGGKDALKKALTIAFQEFYSDAAKEIDCKVPIPLIDEIKITAFVDSDYMHDKVMHRLITGLLVLLGHTPIFCMSKRQGVTETSTYSAEFCAMRTSVKKVPVISTVLDSLLKKKHMAIVYHKTWEAVKASIIHPVKVAS